MPAYVAPKPPEPKRELVLIDRPGSVQADMRMGKIAATFNDPDYFPETVGSIIEGGGPNSRLFLDIREKRGYAYDVHTEVGALADAGTFSAVTQVRNDVAADALQGILEHLDRMAKEPVEQQELTDAKSYANGVFLLGMEPQRGLADRLVQMKVMNLPKNYLETYTTKINSVEPDQIESAAKKYMATGQRCDRGGRRRVGDRRSRWRSSGPFASSSRKPNRTANQTNENHFVEGSLPLRSVSGHRRRSGGPHRLEDEAQHRAPRGSAVMMAVDDEEPRDAGQAIPSARESVPVGTARREDR